MLDGRVEVFGTVGGAEGVGKGALSSFVVLLCVSPGNVCIAEAPVRMWRPALTGEREGVITEACLMWKTGSRAAEVSTGGRVVFGGKVAALGGRLESDVLSERLLEARSLSCSEGGAFDGDLGRLNRQRHGSRTLPSHNGPRNRRLQAKMAGACRGRRPRRAEDHEVEKRTTMIPYRNRTNQMDLAEHGACARDIPGL